MLSLYGCSYGRSLWMSTSLERIPSDKTSQPMAAVLSGRKSMVAQISEEVDAVLHTPLQSYWSSRGAKRHRAADPTLLQGNSIVFGRRWGAVGVGLGVEYITPNCGRKNGWFWWNVDWFDLSESAFGRKIVMMLQACLSLPS